MYVLCFNTNMDYKYTAVANTLKEAAEHIADHVEEYSNDEFNHKKLVEKYKKIIKEQNEFDLDECPEHSIFVEFYPEKRIVDK